MDIGFFISSCIISRKLYLSETNPNFYSKSSISSDNDYGIYDFDFLIIEDPIRDIDYPNDSSKINK